jgi:hypothetical protein
LQALFNTKLDANSPITGATKTKITYDLDGLVTAGADATTTDIAEGSNLYYTDARVSANEDVVKSAKTDAWSIPKGGAMFDGIDDYYSLADTPNLNFGTGDFSITAKIRLNNISGINTILYKRDTGFYYFRIGENQVSFGISDGTDTYQPLTTTASLVANKDYYITVALSRVSGVSIYVGDVAQSFTATGSVITTSISNAGNLILAAPYNFNPLFFNGKIYYVRLWNRALTQAEVTKLYGNGLGGELDYADKGASQTPIYTSDFSASTGWSVGSYWSIAGGVASYTNTGNNALTRTLPMIGRRFRISFEIGVADATLYISAGDDKIVDDSIYPVGINSVDAVMATGNTLTIVGLASGNSFTLDNLSITPIGCVAEIKPESFGTNGAIATLGGELTVANSFGSPTALSNVRDGRSGVSTSEIILTSTQKANTILKGVWVIEKSGSANTIFLGTATGTYDLANGESIGANGTKYIDINELSLTDRSLYCKAGASSLTFILDYEEL